MAIASAAPHLIDSSKENITLCCKFSWDSNFLAKKRGLEYPAENEGELQEKGEQQQMHDEETGVGKVEFHVLLRPTLTIAARRTPTSFTPPASCRHVGGWGCRESP